MTTRRPRPNGPLRAASLALTATAVLAPTSLVAVTALQPAATPGHTPDVVHAVPVAEATTPTVREFAVPAAPRRTADAVVTAARPVEGYGVVGVTWEGNAPASLELEVRTRDEDGWSTWTDLHADESDAHGPDPGSPEALAAEAAARGGTDALAVGEVDAVQLRASSATGALPEDLTLAVVDPGVTTPVAARDGQPAPSTALTPVASTTGKAAQPEILTRAQWGADERMRNGSPSYGTVRAAFVHHTVNTNTYTREQVPSIIRGIYAYHTQSRKWSDVGYNFLVDRFGRIWEGRYGGMSKAVMGAHTLGYNHVAFAASAIGNWDIATPPAAVADAYARLLAWKLDVHGVSATSTPTLEGKRFAAISGHRDAGSTACPGRYLYAQLPTIRSKTAAIQAKARTQPPTPTPTPTPTPSPTPTPTPTPTPAPPAGPGPELDRDVDGDGRADLLVRDAATGRIMLLPGQDGPGFAERRTMRIPSGKVDLVAGTGDVTGDGLPDLITRVAATGVAQVRAGKADGLFGKPLAGTETTRLQTMDQVTGAGDLDGDGLPDLVARDTATARLWLLPGRPGGLYAARRSLPVPAGQATAVTGPGDLTGDGRADLLVTTPDGRLLLHPGDGFGGLEPATQVADGWGMKDLTVAGADFTGDGVPDLLARDRLTRRTWIHPLRPGGVPGPRFGGWTEWADLHRLTLVGSHGTGTPRLVARTATGELTVLDALGTAHLGAAVDTGRKVADGDFAGLAGDWDDDGHVDAITRSVGTGNVGLHRGSGDGLLSERTRLWAGFTDKARLVVSADLTGDATPDLVSVEADGSLAVHPGTAAAARQTTPARVARTGLFAVDLVAAVGMWDGDQRRDLVVRHAADRALYLLPGRAGGTFGTPVRLSGKAGAYDRLVGAGDADGDGRPDLLATRPDGTLWLLPGGAAGIGKKAFLAEGLGRYDLLG